MNKLLKPNLYYQNIYTINYNQLKDKNINYLLFDIDNTIADDSERIPCEKAVKLINSLKKDFNIILITNALPIRAKRFAKALDVPYYAFSIKPLKKTYQKIIKDFNLDPKEIAAIGDQLYTDILGANKMAITSIFLDKKSNIENIFTKYNRIRENIIIKKYNIIERGNYND